MAARGYKEVDFEATMESDLLDGGWSPWSGAYDAALGLDSEGLFDFIEASQAKAWDRLVDRHGDEKTARREFARLVAREIDERGVLDVLRRPVRDRGIAIRLCYFRPGHTLAEGALDQYSENRLAIARQFPYSAKDSSLKLDLALLVNGIPVATAELKNLMTEETVEDAKEQYRTKRDPKELLFARRALVHFAVDPHLVFLTTRLEGPKTRFLPFNLGSSGPGVSGGAGNPKATAETGYRSSYLWRVIWQRDNWLELLERFIHVQNADTPGMKSNPHTEPRIFPRFHQWHAVREMVADAQSHGAGRNYLVQHSAGSGKSNTIAWLAHRLSTLHTSEDEEQISPQARAAGIGPNQKVFEKVIVITDRRVLDKQLQKTIFQFEHTAGVVELITEDSGQLAAALSGSSARIIVTTLQKFDYVLGKIAGLGDRRYAIVVDEAHSSQGGDASGSVKEALGAEAMRDVEEEDKATRIARIRGRQANLSYFAFTATPKHGTLELFGRPDPRAEGGYRAFHTYSMRQAVDEGFILDVLANYISYTAMWRLRNKAIELEKASAINNPEVDARKAKAKLVRFAELHPESLAQRAQLIVKDFRDHVARRLDGRGRAMIVCRSREDALKTYQAILTHARRFGITDCEPLVAFSGTLEVEGAQQSEAQVNMFPERELPARFGYCKADDKQAVARNQREYRILVVAEKYDTGFDQPLLAAMYVLKPLHGVKAVQTLSRLNRIHPRKQQDDVRILDFVNDAESIRESFRPYFESTLATPTDPNLLNDKQRAVIDHGIIEEHEVKAFADLLLGQDLGQLTPARSAKVHARLQRYLDPAIERWGRLLEESVEHAEQFRADLNSYVRAYPLLGQIIDWSAGELEELYQYGKLLLRALPGRPQVAVDTGQTELSHYRLQKVGEHRLSLAPDGEQVIEARAPGGGGLPESEEMPLSAVIAELNERFGIDLGTVDQVMIAQQAISLMEDDKLADFALMNDDPARFLQVAGEQLDEIVVRNAESNTAFVNRYFENDELRQAIKEIAARQAYNGIRSNAREEAIRKLRAIQSSTTGNSSVSR